MMMINQSVDNFTMLQVHLLSLCVFLQLFRRMITLWQTNIAMGNHNLQKGNQLYMVHVQ